MCKAGGEREGGGCKGRHEGVYAVYVVRGYVLSEPV